MARETPNAWRCEHQTPLPHSGGVYGCRKARQVHGLRLVGPGEGGVQGSDAGT